MKKEERKRIEIIRLNKNQNKFLDISKEALKIERKIERLEIQHKKKLYALEKSRNSLSAKEGMTPLYFIESNKPEKDEFEAWKISGFGIWNNGNGEDYIGMSYYNIQWEKAHGFYDLEKPKFISYGGFWWLGKMAEYKQVTRAQLKREIAKFIKNRELTKECYCKINEILK